MNAVARTISNIETDPLPTSPARPAAVKLALRASEKQRRSAVAAAIAAGPTLLAEAAAVLGDFEQESEDVLQDFLLFLLEGWIGHERTDGPVLPWMCGIVREIARRRRADRERDWEWDVGDGG
jgi:hypothetical protein